MLVKGVFDDNCRDLPSLDKEQHHATIIHISYDFKDISQWYQPNGSQQFYAELKLKR